MTNPTLTWTNLPDDETAAKQVAGITRRAAAADGIDPLSEQFLLGLDDARLGHRHLLALDGDEVIAAAALSGDEAEFVVDPDRRGAGVGGRLYDELAAQVSGLKVWSHGNGDAARELARTRKLRVTRRLLVMEIDGQALTHSAGFSAPEGVTVANLSDSRERWGADAVERAWLEVNNDAFSWHPEQGGWDLDRLRRAMEAPWFDPQDVWFIWDTSGASGGVPPLAGFHWTKWHDEKTAEVYVVGLSGAYRGRGLGGPVVSMGLAHLVRGSADRVILYVEDDNEAAVRRYRSLGFSVAEEHVVYAR